MLSHDDANGEITQYRVCYKPVISSANLCKSFKAVNKNIPSTTVFGLEKYTSYFVAVSAATAIGFGPPGTSVIARTLEDGK